MNDREYLEKANILKLNSAAKMAGLKWKNGTPGFDKAGIINKLEQHPSIMRATIATLQRFEKGEAPNINKQPGSFLDDIADEQLPDFSQVSPKAPPTPLEAQKPQDNSALREAIDKALRGLGVVERKVAAIEPAYASVAYVDAKVNPLEHSINILVKSVLALQERKPVQFIIEGKALPLIQGQHKMFPRLVKWLSMRKVDPITRKGPRTHVLLVGPASSGKTTAAIEYAKLMGLELYAQPLSMDSFAVIGYTSPNGEPIETEFTRAWTKGGVYLWDEMSMSSPEALGTLNSALANGFIAIPGHGTVYAHPDFYMIAGDNSDTGASIKYGARSLLDGASLDRFIRLEWDIDTDIETTLAGNQEKWLNAVRAIRAEITRRDIAHVGATMRAVIMGCMALDAGVFTKQEILEDTCKKGALVEEWSYFTNLPQVQTFLRS